MVGQTEIYCTVALLFTVPVALNIWSEIINLCDKMHYKQWEFISQNHDLLKQMSKIDMEVLEEAKKVLMPLKSVTTFTKGTAPNLRQHADQKDISMAKANLHHYLEKKVGSIM